jgi:hypothetical protein
MALMECLGTWRREEKEQRVEDSGGEGLSAVSSPNSTILLQTESLKNLVLCACMRGSYNILQTGGFLRLSV